MRLLRLAAVLSLLAIPAWAQAAAPATTSDATSAGTAAPQHRKHASQQERFDKANTSHDGHLTKDQAQTAHMKYVAEHFDAIDADKKGYVTLDEIRGYRKAQRAARKAAKASSNG